MNETETIQQIVNLVSSGSIVTTLLVILYTGAKGQWVFGWVYNQEKARAEEWRSLALNGTHVLGAAVQTLESATKKGQAA